MKSDKIIDYLIHGIIILSIAVYTICFGTPENAQAWLLGYGIGLLLIGIIAGIVKCVQYSIRRAKEQLEEKETFTPESKDDISMKCANIVNMYVTPAAKEILKEQDNEKN